MQCCQNAKFGMIFQWSLYSNEVKVEWEMFNNKIPEVEYGVVVDTFNQK